MKRGGGGGRAYVRTPHARVLLFLPVERSQHVLVVFHRFHFKYSKFRFTDTFSRIVFPLSTIFDFGLTENNISYLIKKKCLRCKVIIRGVFCV